MQCSTVTVDCDYYGPSFLNIRNRRARKSHKCYECRREILPGETYLYESGLWEGEFSFYKICDDCRSLRAAFFNGGFYYGQIWSDIWEHIIECSGKINETVVAGLSPTARDKVCKIIEEAWERDHESGRI